MSLMLEEIGQQPGAVEKTLNEELPHAQQIRDKNKPKPPLVVLVARGTSDNAAQFGRYLLEVVAGIPVSLAAPSVTTVYKRTPAWKDALVIGISQSGESTDINVCLEAARDAGAEVWGVTNEPESKMAQIAHETWLVRAGRERSVAATKTYTGQLMAIYLIAYALGAAIDPEKLKLIAGRTSQSLALDGEVRALAERYRFMHRSVVVGRGMNYSNAFELALKLMETCYVVAERFSGADFAHGPIAIVERDFPAFQFAIPGPVFDGSLELARRLRSMGAETVLFSPLTADELGDAAVKNIVLPAAPDGDPADLYSPIPAIVPGQLFAAHLAEVKGLDPDQPRGLQKVTKTL